MINITKIFSKKNNVECFICYNIVNKKCATEFIYPIVDENNNKTESSSWMCDKCRGEIETANKELIDSILSDSYEEDEYDY